MTVASKTLAIAAVILASVCGSTSAADAKPIQSGGASWYGPGFHGKRTANGERFNTHALTAAHRSLPFGSRVQVTNERTGRSVVVRINDRGPFVGGRVIDLLYELRLIRPAWLTWATSESLSRDGADRHRGPGSGLRRLVRDRLAF